MTGSLQLRRCSIKNSGVRRISFESFEIFNKPRKLALLFSVIEYETRRH